jgi:ABC-type transport system substrate-binding protein
MDAGFGYGYGSSFYDPDPFYDHFRPGHQYNRSKIDDPALLDLIAKQRRLVDPAERKAAVDDIQRHTAMKLYYIITVDPPQASAWQPWFKNWFMFDGADYGYTYIEAWTEQ